MIHARAFAPQKVKRLVWDFKHRHGTTNASHFPADFLETIVPRLRAGCSILDLGCAQGNLLVALRHQGWDGQYVGVDISQKAIETAEKIADEKARWHVSSVEDFPYMKVDVVCFVESLYYVRNVPAVISRWGEANIYVRIVHSDRHQDCISHLVGFQQVGCVYYRERHQERLH